MNRWISQRARRGTPIGGTKGMKFVQMPLKKIAVRLRISTDLFDQDYVELECGHMTHSNGIYRARCPYCTK